VREHVEAHLDSRLDIDALAQVAGMSVSQFNRWFPKVFGMAPHRYVIQCRLRRARELLATTRLPLNEIALIIGFADQSHFSRRFHEFIGEPPRQFRKRF
jgi:transcriptional regulator GlxA family with amidase domain